MKKITWCLLVLSLSLFSACLGGKTNARRESVAIPPTGSAGTNIVKFENAVARCGFQEVAENDYEVTCHTLIDRGGSEVLPDGKEPGLDLYWQQPSRALSCSEKRNGLTYRCRVLLVEGETTEIRFDLKLQKASQSRIVSDEVVLPIEISTLGMPPQIPRFFKTLPDVVTQNETGKLAGYQRRYLGQYAHHWITPQSVCHTQKRVYFSSGSHVYAYEKERASTGKAVWLFAGGTGEVERTTHPLLLKLSPRISIDCTPQSVYVFDAPSLRVIEISHQAGIQNIHTFSSNIFTTKSDTADIEVTSQGEIYLSQGGLYQIEFSGGETTIREIALSGIQGDVEIGALESDENGILYACEVDGGAVMKIARPNASGVREVESFGARLFKPSGIALKQDGGLYVSDFEGAQSTSIPESAVIWEFSPELADGSRTKREVWRSGRDGLRAVLSLAHPRGLTLDGSTLYFADQAGIGYKTSESEQLFVLVGLPSTRPNRDVNEASFAERISMTMSPDGTIYVAEQFGIYEVDPITVGEKRTLRLIAGGGRGFSEGTGAQAGFRGISGITMDRSGNLYAADARNHRIRKISRGADGRWTVSTIAGHGLPLIVEHSDALQGSVGTPQGIAAGRDGALYVSSGTKVLKISPPDENEVRSLEVIAGGNLEQETSVDELENALDAKLGDLSGIAVGNDERVYVVDRTHRRIPMILPPDILSDERPLRSIETVGVAVNVAVGPNQQIFYSSHDGFYSTSVENAQTQRISKEIPGQICGAGVLEEAGAPGDLGERLSSSIAKVCQGRSQGVFAETQCSPQQTTFKLILSQQFDDYYSNAIEVSLPCPN